jgi:ubiquinone/menaquinone biosynthesis C-methylase UbiE
LGAIDYDQTTIPAEYDAGRGYAPAVLKSWLDTISSAVPPDHIDDILDLGCGTGRYSAALAAHFNARVVAVDPSDKMLSEARKKATEGVRFVRGSGEAMPLESATVDMVFMSMVFHHFSCPRRAAEECHRVLREDGFVCLRAGSTDRMDSYPYVPFFPRTPVLLANNLQSLETIETTFRGAGFQLVHQEVVNSEVAASWHAYADKTAHRADSILVQLTDQEFDEGLAALRTYAAAERSGHPVIEPVDFLVFRRT